MAYFSQMAPQEWGSLPRLRLDPANGWDSPEATLYDALAPEEAAALKASAHLLVMRPRCPIIFRGEPAEHLFNVVSGTVKVFRQGQDGQSRTLGFLGAGDVFGLPENRRYANSAETLTEARIWKFPRRPLQDVLAARPLLGAALLAKCADELLACQRQVLTLSLHRSTARVLAFIGNLQRSLGSGGSAAPQDTIPLPMTRAEIAEYLGLTESSTSRSLRDLHRNGVIALQRHAIQVLNQKRVDHALRLFD